ncbi:hypothetical protein E2N92_01990 [Methanofollis formosanus]|uniref:CARDB domain-containing protein n=1 Tax=Methanofollis formosanus TaxID=299308 RepID=A0A8G1EFW4_9EURY|nr:CARDB domain-containing protein [Methanofollis formosanus]QYZ78287.1 hypothetical protein E2N92_01990 [Methanofollis formosanus]
MRIRLYVMLLLIAVCTGAVTAEENTAAQVAITGVAVDPGVLMKGDTGTVTVTVTNNGQTSVPIARAALLGNDLSVQDSGIYSSVSNLGAGNSMDFTFTVQADTADGIYYPSFYLDYRDAGSLRYPVPVKVESSGLEVSVLQQPEVYAEERTETVTLLIGNPRENMVSGVTVRPVGEGIETTQTSAFVGDLQPGGSAEVTFDLRASQSTDLTFETTYRNGMNSHTAATTVPVEVGEGKVRAEPVVNNINVVQSGGQFTVSGDVNNAGLEEAKSVVVTVAEPAIPSGAYPAYVVGALEPDDFSSFEVTFTASGTSPVPLLVQYKDGDGNAYETSCSVDLRGAGTAAPANGDVENMAASKSGGRNPMGTFGGGLQNLPITEILVGLLVVVGALVAWRKGLFAAAVRKGRARLGRDRDED